MSSEVLRDPLLVKDSTGILSHCTGEELCDPFSSSSHHRTIRA